MVRSEVMEVDRADQELSDKEKERSKRSEREKDRGREKEKDKEKSKDHREKDRDREKEKDRAKEKERERVKEKEREREKDRGRDRGRDREKEREKDKDKDRHRERIGHGHDKEHETVKDKERHHDKSGHGREKDHDIAREKHREKSPHETDVKKEKSRDADREKEKSKAKEGDREKEKDREKHGAREKTRDRDEKVKEKHSDRDRSKDEEKDKDREKHNGREKTREKDEKVKEKHSERDKGKDEEKDKERDKHGAREKARDKDEKAKEKHSERDKSKDEEKEKREREKEREKEKAKEREREKDKEREREKEKEREKERERERERERDREERERDRERERERENEKERERQRIRHREHEHERESEREYDQERDQRTKDMDIDDNRGPEREHARDSDQQHAPNSELVDRLARMREERRKANFDRRPGRRGIRASEKPEDVDDIASWVNKSRQLDEKKKAEEREKAARMAKALEEQENEEGDSDEEFRPSSKYSAKDLAGLKVRHGLDKVMEGGAVVLTLKDTSILADGDVNDETDELENLELAQQTAREDAYKAAKKVAGKYEDKFNNDMTGNKTILSKYDDAIKEEGVTLDESGGVDEEAHRKLEEVRKRLQHGMGDRLAESLLTTTSTIASEYFTQDEMTTFKKPKKKKKLRKKEKLDLDALETEAVAEGLGTTDMGSRDTISRRAVMQDEMKAAADARRERYENAVAKAADASRILKKESEANAMDVDETEEVIVGAEEEEVLAKSLDRARQAALKKQADIASGPQTIAARLAVAKQELSQAQGDGDAEEGKLIFSDTGEFCRSLQLDEALIRRSAPKDVFHEEEKEEGELDPLDEEAPGTAPVRGGWTEVGDVEMTDNIKEIPEMEEDSLDEVKEVAVGKGLAGVLQLLKERGSLKETVDWGGRNMDKKKSKLVGIVDESNNVVGQRDILLDRVDEFGRTMTPKEAFRKLSHKFHGKGPGKMKQEKRQKQFQEELKLKQMNAGDTPLMAMEKIREAQAKLHAPYLVISGHIKPGQTSDPRSGFATVEKEPVGSLTPMLGDNKNIGSLTPMLGDKKVAHFLGIKRKPESGSMGPPPNKKPKDH